MYFDDFRYMDFETADFQTFLPLQYFRLRRSLRDFHIERHLAIDLNEVDSPIPRDWSLVFGRCSRGFHAGAPPFALQ